MRVAILLSVIVFIGSCSTKLSEKEKEHKLQLAEIDKAIEEIKKEITALDEERQKFVPQVDLDLMHQYNTILKKREGSALVALEGNSCGGCYMTFPPQTINEIKLKEKIIVCESCSRILYEPI